jgi:very-short-patch-repair endonuclease
MELADAASESPMETRLRVLLVSAGLPKPCVQAEISDGGTFIARVDLLYPEQRLVIEYDGATHRASVAADNRRQNRLIDAGYRILRFTGSDIVRTPAALVGQVRRALAANR